MSKKKKKEASLFASIIAYPYQSPAILSSYLATMFWWHFKYLYLPTQLLSNSVTA